jgi:hydrogenase-4 component B
MFMQQYILGADAGAVSMLFWASAILFAAGMAFPIVFRKNASLARNIGVGAALFACIALFFAGALALFGYDIAPIVLASGTQIGSISYGVDALSGFFAALIGLVGVSISVYSFSYIAEYKEKGYSIQKFVFLFNLFLLSMAMVATAQNALAFLVFWEIMAISSYYLVSFEHKEESSKDAGFVYLLMTHFGTACLILMFLILSGGAGGSMDFSAFAHAGYAGVIADAIFVLALIGFGVKAGMMPFHVWLPIAHPQAPSNISALMSGVMLKTAIYGMIRVIFGFLLAGSVPSPMWWGILVLALGAVSALMGVLYSLMEHDLKILLAYHSIENIGIILIGIGAAMLFSSVGLPLVAAIALFAALFHTLNHALFKSLLFSGAGAVIHSTHTRNIDELGGLAKRMPVAALLFFVGAASIAALPPLNGFVSEWLTFVALLGGLGTSGTVSLASAGAMIFLALTSAFAVAAFVKAFGITFLGTPRSSHVKDAADPPSSMLAGMAILAVACVLAGIFPGFIAQAAFPILSQFGMPGATGIPATAASLPTLGIFIALAAIGAAALLFTILLKKIFHGVQATGPTWDCGMQEGNGHMQYSAKGFTMPIIRAFDFLVSPLGKASASGHLLFEALIYSPLQRAFLLVSPWSRKLQTGNLIHYLLYLMVTLVAVISYAILS